LVAPLVPPRNPPPEFISRFSAGGGFDSPSLAPPSFFFSCLRLGPPVHEYIPTSYVGPSLVSRRLPGPPPRVNLCFSLFPFFFSRLWTRLPVGYTPPFFGGFGQLLVPRNHIWTFYTAAVVCRYQTTSEIGSSTVFIPLFPFTPKGSEDSPGAPILSFVTGVLFNPCYVTSLTVFLFDGRHSFNVRRDVVTFTIFRHPPFFGSAPHLSPFYF